MLIRCGRCKNKGNCKIEQLMRNYGESDPGCAAGKPAVLNYDKVIHMLNDCAGLIGTGALLAIINRLKECTE